MTDYTASIRRKGLDSTGVTEEVARKLYGNRGGYVMAIVELKVEQTHDDAEGNHGVDLTIQQCEPAMDAKLEEHLRDLTRAQHNQRKLHDETHQPTLGSADEIEPTVADVMRDGRHLASVDDTDQPDEQDDATQAAREEQTVST